VEAAVARRRKKDDDDLEPKQPDDLAYLTGWFHVKLGNIKDAKKEALAYLARRKKVSRG